MDRAVPRTSLLECTGAKHRAELVHRSQGLTSRHRPSGEGLRSLILRRDDSSSSISRKEDSGGDGVLKREDREGSITRSKDTSTPTVINNSSSSSARVMQQQASNAPVKTVSSSQGVTAPTKTSAATPSQLNTTPPQTAPSLQPKPKNRDISTTPQVTPSRSSPPKVTPPKAAPAASTAISHQASPPPPASRQPPTPHPKPPQSKPGVSFLAEIQAAQRRRGLDESPDSSPPQTTPQGTPPRTVQTAPRENPPQAGGVVTLQEQLRSRLEARKRSMEEETVPAESLGQDIRSSNSKGVSPPPHPPLCAAGVCPCPLSVCSFLCLP